MLPGNQISKNEPLSTTIKRQDENSAKTRLIANKMSSPEA